MNLFQMRGANCEQRFFLFVAGAPRFALPLFARRECSIPIAEFFREEQN